MAMPYRSPAHGIGPMACKLLADHACKEEAGRTRSRLAERRREQIERLPHRVSVHADIECAVEVRVELAVLARDGEGSHDAELAARQVEGRPRTLP